MYQVYRRFRVVSPACPPPVPGRSASFRLRFHFVRVVRAVGAGEVKLRGRMTIVVLIAGPPGCEYPGVVPGVLSLVFCAWAHGFERFLVFFEGSSWFFVVVCMS